MRLVFLDTETTGLSKHKPVNHGHRLIEIACVEVVDGDLTGSVFHRYVNPQMRVSEKAEEIHGISDAFLADKPTFKEIAEEFIAFIDGSDLVIHNAEFDVSFIDYEFKLLQKDQQPDGKEFRVFDTLALARRRWPGADNTLKGLCRRFNIDYRGAHSALQDAIILSKVYPYLI